MQYVTPFITFILGALADFLMSEPIIYFVSIFIVLALIKLIITIFHA